MKIEALTSEQEALLPVYRDKWLKIGLSTEPLDFKKAKLAVCKCYALAGLSPPKHFYRFASPLSAVIGASILKKIQARDQVRHQVGVRVWAQARHQVKGQVEDQVRHQVGGQVWGQVEGQVEGQVKGQVEDQVRHQVGIQAGEQLWEQLWGNHSAAPLSYYNFLQDILKIDCGPMSGLIDISKHCGWWEPYANTVVLQDRPNLILFDDQKRLHNETGPSVTYRDGFSVYSWHGTRIPGDWIKKPPAADLALKWDNLEQRRAACEIVGWHNILKQLNATTIDKAAPEIGELLEVVLPDIGKERFLKVRCATGRTFALPVPPEIETAQEANAWTYGLAANDYAPEIRT